MLTDYSIVDCMLQVAVVLLQAPAANGKGCGELKEKSSAVPGDAMVPPPARSDKRGFVSSIRTGLAKVAAAALGNRPQAAPRQKVWGHLLAAPLD